MSLFLSPIPGSIKPLHWRMEGPTWLAPGSCWTKCCCNKKDVEFDVQPIDRSFLNEDKHWFYYLKPSIIIDLCGNSWYITLWTTSSLIPNLVFANERSDNALHLELHSRQFCNLSHGSSTIHDESDAHFIINVLIAGTGPLWVTYQ